MEDFSILFTSIENAKRKIDYDNLEKTMITTNELQDSIEKLQEIVMDTEQIQYRYITTA